MLACLPNFAVLPIRCLINFLCCILDQSTCQDYCALLAAKLSVSACCTRNDIPMQPPCEAELASCCEANLVEFKIHVGHRLGQ